MHEFSLMADLLRKIEQVAADNGASRVVKVRVWLGALSHITPEHFRVHFEDGVRSTLADGAELEVETSDDESHPEAQQILLKSLDVA